MSSYHYDIWSSPLYKLRNKRRLAALLCSDYKTIKELIKRPNYKTFTDYKGDKPRNIEEPKKILKTLQKRLKRLLSKLRPPQWLSSGVKDKSYVDNARIHKNHEYLIKCDIKSYYKSATREFVFRFFRNILFQEEDIAWLLTDLVTYNNYIPTGSPTSQLIAFWAYSPIFDQIQVLSLKENITMSLYVDDITFSSNEPISQEFIFNVNGILKSVGLCLKRKKTRFYGRTQYKKVTGVIITPQNQLKVPNTLRKKIIMKLIQIKKEKETCIDNIESLIGLLLAARQIEPNFLENTYRKYRKLN